MRASVPNESVGELLGLARPRAVKSELDLMDRLDAGLSVVALDQVAARIAPDDKAFRYRLVPRATLARRDGKTGGSKLSVEQGAKVARLAKLWTVALDVWKDPDAARAFLWRPHALLDGRTPVDVALQSEFGGPVVEGLLRRLQYGSAV